MSSFKKIFDKTETFLFLIIVVFSLIIFFLNRSFMLPENILGKFVVPDIIFVVRGCFYPDGIRSGALIGIPVFANEADIAQ